MFQRLARRSFLAATATTVAVVARAASAAPTKRAKVRIGYRGASCEAATYVAFENGLFAREGLEVELVRLRDGPLAAHAAIAAGAIDALSAPLYSWLDPIGRGLDARLTAGLHGGCVRLVAATASPIRELGEAKGATIATDRIGGPTMDFFASLLRKREIDPARDVRWRAYEPAEFAAALEHGDAQIVAAGDPAGYALLRDRRAVAITDNLSAGIFYCDRGISHSHNCFLVVRGVIVRDEPRVAAGLTWAWRDATRWVGAHVTEAARIAVRNGYVATDAATTTGQLASYGWHPSADLALEEIELTARDFKRAGLLDSQTDPEDLAEHIYADVFNAVDG
jgi:NitT/TauT family transport system substrate-binding protein